MPCIGAAAQHADICEAGRKQLCRGLCRTPVRLADKDDGTLAGGQHRAVPADIGERHIDCTRQMAGRRRVFIRLSDIDERYIAGRKMPLQFGRIDPCRFARAKPSEEARQECDHGEYSKSEKAVAQSRAVSRGGRPAGIAEPRWWTARTVSKSAGNWRHSRVSTSLRNIAIAGSSAPIWISFYASGGWIRLSISGTTTENCCHATARDAMFRNYRVVFLSDVTATYDYPDCGFGPMPNEVHHATLVIPAASTAHVMPVQICVRGWRVPARSRKRHLGPESYRGEFRLASLARNAYNIAS
jgi:hypothetical protein